MRVVCEVSLHLVDTLLQAPKTLQYNPAENALLITSDVEGGVFELYIIPKESARGDTAPVSHLCRLDGQCMLDSMHGKRLSELLAMQ
jgi:hypothetical protein